MELKFNARKVAELETKFGKTIEEIIQDTRMETLAYVVSKTIVNDSEEKPIGCSLEVAYDKIDEYLQTKENGTQELTLLIIDGLVATGFLNQAMKNTRAMVEAQMEKVKATMK